MSNTTIFHNPACGTSRNTLAMIRSSGVEPIIVEYLESPPDTAQIRQLLSAMGSSVRDVLRKKGTPYVELDLDNPQWSDEQLLAFIEQHCPRRSRTEPPRRLNREPGVEADAASVGCG